MKGRSKVGAWRAAAGAILVGVWLSWVGGLAAQERANAEGRDTQPLSVEAYDGWRDWPLRGPGEVELDNDRLESQRTTFDFHVPSGEVMTMLVDVFADMFFKGRPAIWVQHTSSGVAGSPTGTSVLDAMIMDRETFRVQFRVGGGQGERDWSGPYDITQHHPDKVVRVRVADDGSVESKTLDEATNPFDFAAMPYLFPFMDLEEGQKFRLRNIGNFNDMTPNNVGVWVKGRTTITHALGREHEVTEVEMISRAETVLYTMYVDDEAPYFYGWRFRNIETGETWIELKYRSHVVLDEGG